MSPAQHKTFDVMIDLMKLPDHLKAIREEDWSKLFDLIPEINQTTRFGEHMGLHIEPSEVVRDFLEIADELDIIPAFDWTDWHEGKAILRNHKQDYEKLDAVTICKLFTVIIRTDRFASGTLVLSFKDGTISKMINALKNKFS
jgi:hypothetical protein